MMDYKSENAFQKHIDRLQAIISGRDNEPNTMDAELNKVDRKNIASLREGRIPQYRDHIDAILGDDEMPMREFSDLVNAS